MRTQSKTRAFTSHERINVRGHLSHRGVPRLGSLTERHALFLSYRCTGHPLADLAASPHRIRKSFANMR